MACFCCLDPDTKDFKKDLPFEVTDNPIELMLKEIFSVNPETGLPKGDIQYYLSANGNPQLKQWLENNLLSPRGISSNHGNYDDDTLVEFSRGHDESVSAYTKRMKSIFDECSDILKKQKASDV